MDFLLLTYLLTTSAATAGVSGMEGIDAVTELGFLPEFLPDVKVA
jgi:hypothetical protein